MWVENTSYVRDNLSNRLKRNVSSLLSLNQIEWFDFIWKEGKQSYCFFGLQIVKKKIFKYQTFLYEGVCSLNSLLSEFYNVALTSSDILL